MGKSSAFNTEPENHHRCRSSGNTQVQVRRTTESQVRRIADSQICRSVCLTAKIGRFANCRFLQSVNLNVGLCFSQSQEFGMMVLRKPIFPLLCVYMHMVIVFKGYPFRRACLGSFIYVVNYVQLTYLQLQINIPFLKCSANLQQSLLSKLVVSWPRTMQTYVAPHCQCQSRIVHLLTILSDCMFPKFPIRIRISSSSCAHLAISTCVHSSRQT